MDCPPLVKYFYRATLWGLTGNGVGFAGQHASMRVIMLIGDREPILLYITAGNRLSQP